MSYIDVSENVTNVTPEENVIEVIEASETSSVIESSDDNIDILSVEESDTIVVVDEDVSVIVVEDQVVKVIEVDNGPHFFLLTQLTDVTITTPANQDALYYDIATSTWLNGNKYLRVDGTNMMLDDLNMNDFNIINIGHVSFDIDHVPEGEPAGTSYWDSENDTMSTTLLNGVVGQWFEEDFIPVQNDTGGTVVDGMVATYGGGIGNSGNIRMALTVAAADENPILTLGIVTQDIVNGGTGKVTTRGKVRGFQTDGANYGETWLEGQILYKSPSVAGGLTNVEPQAPIPAIPMAVVVSPHESNGTLLVRPTFPQALTSLTDVNGKPVDTSGQILVWDNSNNYFDFSHNINDYLLKDSFSEGSVLFRGATGITEDNANFNWDDTNKILTVKKSLSIDSDLESSGGQAINIDIDITSGVGGGNIFANRQISTLGHSSNLDGMYGYHSSIQTTSSGIVTDGTNFFGGGFLTNGGFTNFRDIHIGNVFKLGGTITNAYGIQIEDVDYGTNNWAIKTGLGLVSFGDDVIISGNVNTATLNITGLTANSVPFIGASGLLSEDNTNFIWDDSLNKLTLGGDLNAQNIELYNGVNFRAGLYADPTEFYIYGSPKLTIYSDTTTTFQSSKDMVFDHNTGELSIAGDVDIVGNLDLGFTQNSIIFQGANGLTENNTNFTFDDSTKTMTLSSTGDTTFKLLADTDNVGEEDNPRFVLGQDALEFGGLGLVGSAGQIYTSSLGNAMYLVNDLSTALQFGTDNKAWITLLDTGFVGFGTNNPQTPLDILGTGDTRIQIRTTNANAFYGYELSKSDGVFNGGIFRNTSGEDRLRIFNETSEIISVMDNGRVGINNTNPGRKFSVYESVGIATSLFESGGATGAVIAINNDNANAYVGLWLQQNQSNTWAIGAFNSDDSLRFATGTLGTDDKITFDSNGNIGVGTIAPEIHHSLELYKSGADSVELGIINESGTSTKECIINFGDSIIGIARYQGRVAYRNSTDQMYLYSNGNFALPEITIDDTKVGINQNTPLYSLDIEDAADTQIRLKSTGNQASLMLENSLNTWSVVGDVSPNGFRIIDNTASTVPFHIEAGALTNTLYVDSLQRIGVNTNNPLSVMHLNLPTGGASILRMTAVAQSQSWDMFISNGNLFIEATNLDRDVYFRNLANVMTLQLDHSDNNVYVPNGGVGIGTIVISETLHVENGNIFMATDSNKLILGAGKDMYMYYDGTDAIIDTGVIAPSDLIIDCGTDKTLVLERGVYGDLTLSLAQGRTPANSPTFAKVTDDGAGSTGVFAWHFSPTQVNEVHVNKEFSHDVKLNGFFDIHIHWCPTTTGAGNVRLEVEYITVALDGTIGNTITVQVTAPASGTAYHMEMTEMVTLSASSRGISDQVFMRVARLGNDAADTYAGDVVISTVGIHYEIDTIGSRQEYVK